MINTQIIVVGGGLAGLVSSIQFSQMGYEVVLIEKHAYPRHKVCGEYISQEVLPYLQSLQIDLKDLKPVEINRLKISTQKSNFLNIDLPLGGIGLSRYALDYFLYQKALQNGIQFLQEEVETIDFIEDYHLVKTKQTTLQSKFVFGAYGKRSGLDKRLERNFTKEDGSWLAVKAHYAFDIPSDQVILHNFEGGYCGLSKTETQAVNACYLVSYQSFKRYKDINLFQEEVMCKNQHLKSFFDQAELLFEQPITISQINFGIKKKVERHVFMIGDSAGLIHPLCGNGMAMAIQSAQILGFVFKNLSGSRNKYPKREQLEHLYTKEWNKNFRKRLNAGKWLQKLLLNSQMQEIAYQTAKHVPVILPKIIKQTHGKPIIYAH